MARDGAEGGLSGARMAALKEALSADARVRFAYLFGSHARGDALPTSDIDVAVHLMPDSDSTEAHLELAALATTALGTDHVDLVILDRAPISFRYRVVRDRRVLVDRDPAFRAAFESRTVREGWDFVYHERKMLGLPPLREVLEVEAASGR